MRLRASYCGIFGDFISFRKKQVRDRVVRLAVENADLLEKFAVRLVIDVPPRPENFRTTTLILRQSVLQTHREMQRASVTFEARAGTRSDRVGPQGRAVPAGYPARTTQDRLKPMKKHNLTLDHVKKEARQLLHGLQRRRPEALRRCHAIDPLTNVSRPALDFARIIIAREHGFSSWRKLREHIENSAVDY